MTKYIELQSQSIISAYGGIGSLVETTLGSVIILPFEKWPFYVYEIKDKDRDHLISLSVQDPRLIERLKRTFPKLQHLIRIPLNTSLQNGNKVRDPHKIIAARYFPLWMFCPHCRLFMEYNDWQLKFRDAKLGKAFDKTCPYCRSKSKKSITLEQIRFIKIHKNGDIEDFPWVEWFNKSNNYSTKDCEHSFQYTPSAFSDDLESVKITCSKCNKSVSMKGVFGNFEGVEDARIVLRSSNSVYFPVIIRSLLIPIEKVVLTDESDAEMIYRTEELYYLLNNAKDGDYNDYIDLKDMNNIFEDVSLISVRYLTMVSVLCSYSRVTPISTDLIFDKNKSKHITDSKHDTQYLPCSESIGEGFLISFKDQLIKKWYRELKKNPSYSDRVQLHKKILDDYNPLSIPINDEYTLCKYVLLHTISHLIIKQMEYVCGYPATSLNERIYCSNKDHSGIMIYTIAGSEGSYGGIVTIVENMELKDHVKNALDKARFCVNDPVCYKVGNSSCFSCSLLPETSCEAFNLLLDRSFVVHKDYGFMNFLK